MVDTYGELIFLTLFLRVVNDPNLKCRDKVAQVLIKLIQKTSLHRKLLETVFRIGDQEGNVDQAKQ